MKQIKVWVEVEDPRDKTPEQREETCRLLNNMMARLTDPENRKYSPKFWWSERDGKYAVTQGGVGGGFMVCTDNGHWFNLEYYGREEQS